MSTNFIEVVRIDSVDPHPNADRLEITTIKGTTVCTQKGGFKTGDTAVYFPPDMLIPEEEGDNLGVKPYLKHALYEGVRSQCRIAGCRLRGQPSYGFVIPIDAAHFAEDFNPAIGTDVSEWFRALKYEPALRCIPGDCDPELAAFHRYTSIEHLWRYPNAFGRDEAVVVTEKIHGTNSRVGVIKIDGEFQFMCGSHRTVRKQFNLAGEPSLYWTPLTESVMELLNDLCDGEHNVILYGEIYGAGIQDMDYGAVRGYRAFDCSINGVYMDADKFAVKCAEHGVETVPLLYLGNYDPKTILDLTYGPTYLANPDQIKSPFKQREGIVVKPVKERVELRGGRMIFKSVSADYLDRKGATDEE